jgi:hypothetical protein
MPVSLGGTIVRETEHCSERWHTKCVHKLAHKSTAPVTDNDQRRFDEADIRRSLRIAAANDRKDRNKLRKLEESKPTSKL